MEEDEVRCKWCGWEGRIKDLDIDETDKPAYCPECGHGQFDIRIHRKKRREHK